MRENVLGNFHAYWDDVLAQSDSLSYFSDPTNKRSPVGELTWYQTEKMQSSGDFGQFGFHNIYPLRLVCYGVDCKKQNQCGNSDAGTCIENVTLFYDNTKGNADKVLEVIGSQCNCTDNAFGWYCEIPCDYTENNMTHPDGTCGKSGQTTLVTVGNGYDSQVHTPDFVNHND